MTSTDSGDFTAQDLRAVVDAALKKLEDSLHLTSDTYLKEQAKNGSTRIEINIDILEWLDRSANGATFRNWKKDPKRVHDWFTAMEKVYIAKNFVVEEIKEDDLITGFIVILG